MILVTGAAGKTGKAIVRRLAAEKHSVRAMVRRAEQQTELQQLGATEAVVGDLEHAADVSAAVHGVRAVYHICPNMHPREFSIGKSIIDAATQTGVAHFVYHSVLHPQVPEMPHHWEKIRVEGVLFQSGVPFTIVQPTAYMQNVLAHRQRISTDGVYPVPYSAGTRLGMVDLADVAAAVAAIFAAPEMHIGATYELATDERLSQTEVAAVLGESLGRTVQVEQQSLSAWEKQARAAGLGDYQIETLLKMFRYYDRYGLWGNGRVLTWLLGRAPVTFEKFVRDIISNENLF